MNVNHYERGAGRVFLWCHQVTRSAGLIGGVLGLLTESDSWQLDVSPLVPPVKYLM